MQSAAMTFIVCQLATKKETDGLKETFRMLDKNGNGKISIEELQEGYKTIYSHLNEDELKKEVTKIMEQADTDGSGEIYYTEWVVATIDKRNLITDEKLSEAFRMFDKVEFQLFDQPG